MDGRSPTASERTALGPNVLLRRGTAYQHNTEAMDIDSDHDLLDMANKGNETATPLELGDYVHLWAQRYVEASRMLMHARGRVAQQLKKLEEAGCGLDPGCYEKDITELDRAPRIAKEAREVAAAEAGFLTGGPEQEAPPTRDTAQRGATACGVLEVLTNGSVAPELVAMILRSTVPSQVLTADIERAIFEEAFIQINPQFEGRAKDAVLVMPPVLAKHAKHILTLIVQLNYKHCDNDATYPAAIYRATAGRASLASHFSHVKTCVLRITCDSKSHPSAFSLDLTCKKGVSGMSNIRAEVQALLESFLWGGPGVRKLVRFEVAYDHYQVHGPMMSCNEYCGKGEEGAEGIVKLLEGVGQEKWKRGYQ